MSWAVYVTVIVVATAGLVYELIAATAASYLLGDSITQFSTVIGIAEEMRVRTLTDEREFTYYVPAAQEEGAMYPQFFVRVNGDPASLLEPLRRRMQREMPGAAYANAVPLVTLIDPQRQAWKNG